MASVSGTSSIGNTSLRGYGGFATGLDRDALIEQMTQGTTTKINNHKNSMTSTKWKQEAFQSISDKIIDLEDKYFSYASTTNLKDPTTFAKNIITTIGKDDVTKFVSASGSSSMLDYLAISAVKQLATSATLQSAQKGNSAIKSTITADSLKDTVYKTSNLRGTQLKFGTYSGDKYTNAASFTFPSTYKDGTNADGTDKIVTIDYTAEPSVLVDQLNKALEQSDFKLDDDVTIRFELNGDQLSIKTVDPSNPKKADGTYNEVNPKGYVMNDTSSALKALGLDTSSMTADEKKDGVSFGEFNTKAGSFKSAYIREQNMIQYLTGKNLTVSYGGQTKQINLLTSAEAEKLTKIVTDDVNGTGKEDALTELTDLLQKRFDKAFGTGKIEVKKGSSGTLEFNTANAGQELKINSNDSELKKTLGLDKSYSTNLSMDSTIRNNLDKLGFTTEAEFGTNGLVINGVTIDVSLDDTISDMVNKINANKNVGVKASYLSNKNQFVLVATETGSGRDIDLGNDAALKIFGGTGSTATSGKDAIIDVSYGNGITNEIVSSSNTFDLEGMKVTVSGIIGGDWAKKELSGMELNFNSSNPNEESKTFEFMTSYPSGVNVDYTADPKDLVDQLNKAVKAENFELEPGVTIRFEYDSAKDKISIKTIGSDGSDKTTAYKIDGESTALEALGVDPKKLSNTDLSLDDFNKKVGQFSPKWISDTSEAVTFSAKADAEGVTEKIKKFVEEYNAMIKEINSQTTTRPNSNYGPLTDEQKAEMTEKSIENWETQAKAGLLFNDATMRDLSASMQNIVNDLLSSGVKYEDLQKIGLSYSEDYGDGGTLVFDEAKFKSAMETEPETVSNIFTGGGDVKKGLSKIMEDTLTRFATRFPSRNGNSYGRLIEEAGSEKIPSSISKNEIYRRLQDMQKQLETLQQRLATEQDRYISQFTVMETMISKMNAQSGWLSQA